MKFTGTKDYVATDDLKVAVNASIVLERPLLTWHIKSTTKAQQGLYEYDAVSRLRDSQLGDSRVSDISNYIKRGKLWEAFPHDNRPVLLIDEIDKADIEFPNDLLQELDRMEFFRLRARARSTQADPAAPWRASEERAECIAVREACFHGAARWQVASVLHPTKIETAMASEMD